MEKIVSYNINNTEATKLAEKKRTAKTSRKRRTVVSIDQARRVVRRKERTGRALRVLLLVVEQIIYHKTHAALSVLLQSPAVKEEKKDVYRLFDISFHSDISEYLIRLI